MSKTFGKSAAAAVVYIGFAVYLYQPYFRNFNGLQYLIVVNVCLASLGCFALSRRWVSSFWGSLFAGVIYGFGPFMLSLAKFHPTAGFLAATMPWLFLPAVFGPKGKWQWLRVPLSALPFLVILLFFQVSAYYRLFAIPTQAKLHLADLAGLFVPLVMADKSITVVGFYHIPIAAFVMGFSMLLAARRFGIMIILCLGTMLAFCDSFLNISPIMWLAIPILCCSVLIGTGMQGLASAGFADRRWVLMAAVIMVVLSLTTLLLATKYYDMFAGFGSKYAKLLVETAKMYILGAIAVAILYFMARAKLRVHWLRWVVLGLATAVDIFFGARFVVDKIF
jgi:hypothetical protein